MQRHPLSALLATKHLHFKGAPETSRGLTTRPNVAIFSLLGGIHCVTPRTFRVVRITAVIVGKVFVRVPFKSSGEKEGGNSCVNPCTHYVCVHSFLHETFISVLLSGRRQHGIPSLLNRGKGRFLIKPFVPFCQHPPPRLSSIYYPKFGTQYLFGMKGCL